VYREWCPVLQIVAGFVLKDLQMVFHMLIEMGVLKALLGGAVPIFQKELARREEARGLVEN
jgi:hypothetical protein